MVGMELMTLKENNVTSYCRCLVFRNRVRMSLLKAESQEGEYQEGRDARYHVSLRRTQGSEASPVVNGYGDP